MTNDESSRGGDEDLQSDEPLPTSSTVLTTAPKDRLRESANRTSGQELDRRDRRVEHPSATAHQPSMMLHLMVTAAVALGAGMLGAMGYSHFLAPTTGDSSSSHSTSERGASKGSSADSKSSGGSRADSAKQPSTQASSASSIPGFSPAQEVVELKEHINNLDRKMDQLGERVDRLQQLLSLAVPLMQRMTPKS